MDALYAWTFVHFVAYVNESLDVTRKPNAQAHVKGVPLFSKQLERNNLSILI